MECIIQFLVERSEITYKDLKLFFERHLVQFAFSSEITYKDLKLLLELLNLLFQVVPRLPIRI